MSKIFSPSPLFFCVKLLDHYYQFIRPFTILCTIITLVDSFYFPLHSLFWKSKIRQIQRILLYQRHIESIIRQWNFSMGSNQNEYNNQCFSCNDVENINKIFCTKRYSYTDSEVIWTECTVSPRRGRYNGIFFLITIILVCQVKAIAMPSSLYAMYKCHNSMIFIMHCII